MSREALPCCGVMGQSDDLGEPSAFRLLPGASKANIIACLLRDILSARASARCAPLPLESLRLISDVRYAGRQGDKSLAFP